MGRPADHAQRRRGEVSATPPGAALDACDVTAETAAMLPRDRWNPFASPRAYTAIGWMLAAALTAVAAAQAPEQAPAVAAPPPSLTLLLRAPRALDVAQFRRALTEVLGVDVAAARSPTGTFVVADAAALVGRSAAVSWRVEAEAKPHALGAASTRHLIASDRDELGEHTAQLHVRCTSPCADDDAAAAAYRALAAVVVALLGRDVMALGAAQHGTFDPYDGDEAAWRERLLGDDPVDALRPVQSTSLVLFLSKARRLGAKDVAAAFAREWQRPFGAGDDDDDDDATEFVIEADGVLMAKVEEELFLVSLVDVDAPSKEQLAEYPELRMRSVMEKQRQLLRFHVSGEAAEAAEAARRRLVARAAAALWADDVLALSWHCDRRLAYANNDQPQHLRAVDPVAATLGDAPVPVLTAPDETAMKAAMARARAEWPTAAAHCAKGGTVYVKFPFATRTDGIEHMWLRVTRVDGERVHGILENEPVDVAGVQLGSAVVRDRHELSDWFFDQDGVRVGGYTIELLTGKSDAGGDAKAKTGRK